ncbi:X-ray repair cross-complementing protein 5 [Perkinsus chesapeaki]|uniref:X-ray repair cross-complementing protein 5 n=1 Tax=Perkinsus chesapeaki TaxID=330153 RepID=A0A7J6MLU1_PERCH|nr:X-ray repair cross-complementing protein 5 [Perkinsus chesapeaki]
MDTMNLEDDGESHELLKMKDIHNPTLLRFWRTVIERADDPDAPVVGVDEEIDRYLHPERAIEWRFMKDVNALKEVFPLVKVPVDKKKKKKYWRGSPDIETAQAAGYQKPPPVDPSHLVFDFPDEDEGDGLSSPAVVSAQHAVPLFGGKQMYPQVRIGSTTPVKDFTTAVYGAGVTSGLLDEAMRKMSGITLHLLGHPGYDYVDKAVDCIVAMRDAAICYGNDRMVVMDYNKFIHDTLSKCKDNAYLWERVTGKRITYLTSKEASASDKTDKDAEDFLNKQQQQPPQEEGEQPPVSE